MSIDRTYWTTENLAWLAGLLEGEGYIGRRKVFLRIRMRDEDVIARCSLFAIGHLRGPVEGNPAKGHAPMYEWTVTRTDHFVAILSAVYANLGTRRKVRIDQCFDALGLMTPSL